MALSERGGATPLRGCPRTEGGNGVSLAWRAELEEADSKLRISLHECSSLQICWGNWTAPDGSPVVEHGCLMKAGLDDSWNSFRARRGCYGVVDARSEFSRLCLKGCSWPSWATLGDPCPQLSLLAQLFSVLACPTEFRAAVLPCPPRTNQ